MKNNIKVKIVTLKPANVPLQSWHDIKEINDSKRSGHISAMNYIYEWLQLTKQTTSCHIKEIDNSKEVVIKQLINA